MRLVLVHGINNQNSSAEVIARDWTAALASATGRRDLFDGIEVVAPFFGRALQEAEKGPATPAEAVEQGFDALDSEEEAFLANSLMQIAAAANISEADIATIMETEVEQMGVPPHDRTFIAVIQLLERLSPLQGAVALRLLNQAYIYLKRDWVAAEVDKIVRPALQNDEPTVIVSHSLGSVIAFKLLRELAAAGTPAQSPLFLTCGSPLAIRSVQGALGKPRTRPAGIGRWLNAREADDFVTLGQGLTPTTFGPGVENVEVSFDGGDAHAILGYLRSPAVALAVSKAVTK